VCVCSQVCAAGVAGACRCVQCSSFHRGSRQAEAAGRHLRHWRCVPLLQRQCRERDIKIAERRQRNGKSRGSGRQGGVKGSMHQNAVRSKNAAGEVQQKRCEAGEAAV